MELFDPLYATILNEVFFFYYYQFVVGRFEHILAVQTYAQEIKDIAEKFETEMVGRLSIEPEESRNTIPYPYNNLGQYG